MARPHFKIRELILIGIPSVTLIGGAVFLSRRQAIEERNDSGPYRTEITRVEVLPVSPFEAWQGFDTKIIVHANGFGRVVPPPDIQPIPGMPISAKGRLGQQVALVGQVRGLQKSIGITSQDYGNSFEPEHPGVLRALMVSRGGELENTITFLAKTSVFDEGSAVQLKGELWSRSGFHSVQEVRSLPRQWTSKKNGPYWWLYFRSTTAPLNQPLERRMDVDVDRTAPPVVKVSADLLSPVYVHTNSIGDNGSGIVHIDFKPGIFSNSYPLLRSTAAQVFDSQGRSVTMKDSNGFKAYETVQWDINTYPGSAVVRLPVESVPLERGPLKMKVWFAIEDGWPALVEAEVRPAWMSLKPRTLQLQSIRVERSDVIATVHYTGKSPLHYEGPVFLGNQKKQLLFDGRDDTSVTLIPSVDYKRLYTYWSQHYTLANGKSYWFPNAVDVKSVACDVTNHCKVTYKTNALSALKPGQSALFSAHIGIQGDGLLPIQATITRPKK